MEKTNVLKLYLRMLVVAVIFATTLLVIGCEEAHSHDFTAWEITKEASCSDFGSKDRICACGEKESELIPVIAHAESEWITDAAPPCIAEGSLHTECMMCHVTMQSESIRYTGHHELQHEAMAPTCTEIGWGHYVTCEQCDYST